MRVCFLIPPALDGRPPAERLFGCTREHYAFPPLPLLYAAAAVRGTGHEPFVVDCVRQRLPVREFAGSIAWRSAGAFVLHSVGLSKDTDLLAHAAIRSTHGRDKPVVFTGPGPSCEPEAYALDERTFVLRGEVEESLPALLAELRARRDPDPAAFPGLTARSAGGGGAVVSGPPRPPIEDLDALDFPARDLLEARAYFNPKLGVRPFTAVLASRGCAHGCRYCVPNTLAFAREVEGRRAAGGRKPAARLRSAANVVRELEELSAAGYRAVSFIDDEFVWSSERTKEICAALARLGLAWGCLARPDRLDGRAVEELARARCRYVDLGAESFVQEILDDVGKGLRVEEIGRAVHLLKTAGVPVKLNILLGASRLETRGTIAHTVRRALALDPDMIAFSVCAPYPGTPYWDYAREQGLLVDGRFRPVDVQRESLVRLPELTAKELAAAARHATLRFCLRPQTLLRAAAGVRGPGDVLRALRTVWRKVRP